MKIRCIIPVLFLFFISEIGFSQQFGGFPPSVKWKQINTDTARVIFQQGAAWQAQRIATLVHKAAADTPFYMGPGLRKINIVLHNQTTLANGYVGLAPFRSEYYLVPPSDVFEFGNLPWYENLAIHEYRHVQQYNNFNNGLSRGFYYVFGENGLAFANALTIPNWFYEGDAVHSETALTTQGRGRLSSFLSGYNSLWLEGKNYSWMKLRNGSLKDFVPDHYQLGYLMVNYGYLKYGNNFWRNVTYDASAFKGLFYPFQKAIDKYSGVSYKQFRNDALQYYKSMLGKGPDAPLNKKGTVTSYYFPQFISPDSIIYLKSAYNKKPAFYISYANKEEKITTKDIGSEQWFSYRNRKIVYTAFSTSARWSLVNYNDIILLDIDSRKRRILTHKEKYFTPDLSPSGNKIVAVHISDSLESELRILNSANGQVITSIKPLPGQYVTNPKFVDEERIVTGTRNDRSEMTLQVYNLTDNTWRELFPFSRHTTGEPFVYRNNIYFTANFNGNDDIYVCGLKDRKIFQLTTGITGNYFPSVLNDTLLYAHFTAEGYEVEKKHLNETPTSEFNSIALNENVHLYPVAFEHNISGTATRQFETSRYPKSKGLIHFHSLSPYYSDPEITLSLYSDNILNTFSNEVYYTYNQNEASHAVGFNSSYGGFFPVLNAGAEYIFNRTVNTSNKTVVLNQYEIKAGYNIPLSFTRGRTYKFLDFGTNFVFNNTKPSPPDNSIPEKNIFYTDNFINWSHYVQTAVQHIYPKLGYVVSIDHRQQLNNNGYQFLASANIFLPSFGNHSIVLSGSFQQTDTNNVVFSNRFALSRGYPGFYFSRMWRLSGNYHFPIAYPDFGIASIVYFQRLRGNLFYDLTRVYSKSKLNTRDLRSTGGELFFDTKWWNQLPVSFGLRFSYLLDYDLAGTNQTYFEVILPLNLIPKR